MFLVSPERCNNTLSNTYHPKVIETKPLFAAKNHCTEVIEPTSDLFAGKKICITGDLPGYDRSDLERLILSRSGKVMSGVSSKTDFLICCDKTEGPIESFTSKHRKALELIEAGEKIRILSADEFFSMIDSEN